MKVCSLLSGFGDGISSLILLTPGMENYDISSHVGFSWQSRNDKR